ncbi:DegV family protein [Holzapfeliella sp. He02]|uniref:DegV family protein n=1 Tax=Holzapfeliella saturejae TaxID=3082953 RepID=A0ABU8SGA9_9LACO
MSKIKIVTDSSVQLTAEEIKQHNITVVPLTITIDGKSYVDGVDIDRETFVQKMKESEDLPKTSQPPIGQFAEVFEELTADGSELLVLTMTKSLSGTVDSARQAAEMVNPDKIHVVDSTFIDRALSFQVLEAAQAVEAGKTLEETLAIVDKVRENTQLQLVVVNLDNLIKGGRLGKVTGRIATMLNIKAVLEVKDSNLDIVGRGRGQKVVKQFINDRLDKIKNENVKGVGISYVDIKDQMDALTDQIHEIKPDLPVLSYETTPVVATHTGLGAFAIIYYTED